MALAMAATHDSPADEDTGSFVRSVVCQIDGKERGLAMSGPRSPLWDEDLRELDEFGDGAIVNGREPDYHVAFTFDDGPRYATTPKVLDALDRYDVPATFFVVGWRFAGVGRDTHKNAQVLLDTAGRGYTIGNHTFSHRKMAGAAPELIRREIDQTTRALRDLLGYTPHTFRPPYGAMGKRARAYLAGEGFTEVRWSIDSNDFRPGAAHALRARTVGQIIEQRGGVVLMHDTKHITADTIAAILDDLERENCRRLDRGEPIIAPVSLHYFMRNRDGTARAVPRRVRARSQRYRAQLPERCQKRRN